MNNYWFKFYGPEYLSDPKMLGMDGNTRSCWITLLSYACSGEGEIKYLTEDQLMIQAGVPLGGDEWRKTQGVLERFLNRGMIQVEQDTILLPNWGKRQATSLTNAERQAKYRKSNEIVTEPVTKVTLEREEKREKIDREEKPTARLDWLIAIPDQDLKELHEKYEASKAQITRKAETMKNYCLSKGKTYKNYRAFLEGGLDKDFGRRAPVKVPEKETSVTLSADEQARIEETKREISAMFKVPSV